MNKKIIIIISAVIAVFLVIGGCIVALTPKKPKVDPNATLSPAQLYNYYNDSNALADSRIGPDGKIFEAIGYSVTGYIPVEPSSTVVLKAFKSDKGVEVINLSNTAFYDVNMNFISRSEPYVETHTIPANCSYIRCSIGGKLSYLMYLGVYYDTAASTPYYPKHFYTPEVATLATALDGYTICGYGDTLSVGLTGDSAYGYTPSASNFSSYLSFIANTLGITAYNRGIGAVTVGDDGAVQTAWVSDGSAAALEKYGEAATYGEYINRPKAYGGTTDTQPEFTVEINADLASDDRIATIPADSKIIVVYPDSNTVTEESYRTMITKIIERCPEADIFCTSMTFSYKDTARTTPNDNTAINETIKSICEEFELSFIDLQNGMGIDSAVASAYMTDNVHHNTDGKILMAQSVMNALVEKYLR